MITPHPTSKIDPTLARGVLGEVVPATVTKQGFVKFLVPNTSYELHLIPTGDIRTQPGKRLIATIRAKARRIDIVTTGGQYVEPVMGRPRRIQGTVLAIKDGALVIDAGVPIHCTPTDPRQTADQFTPGMFVSFDAMDGATLT
jgi:hypothetical protein